HPEYKLITVRLANGDEFQTRSTMNVETYVSDVDSTNHPFYTGSRSALLDTTGRVEKFRRRYGKKSD
ncbi:MAG: 50S ribosomal protein L31, partial [Bacteroidota bacterium]